jgi:hypothetical protein
MRNIVILCLTAVLTAVMGIFNQLYLLSNEECIWYVYGAVTSGAAAVGIIIHEVVLWNKNQKFQ